MRVLQLWHYQLQEVVFNLTEVRVADEGSYDSLVDLIDPVVEDVIETAPQTHRNRQLVVDEALFEDCEESLLFVSFSESCLSQEIVE